MQTKKSADEIARILSGQREGGLTQREYCRREGIPVTTFDYYRPEHRVLTSQQTTGGGSPYQFSYTYNSAGSVETETYPSQRIITTCYDSAGRVASVSGGLNSLQTTYATGPTSSSTIQYTAHGDLSQLLLGSNLFETHTYNSRLQKQQISLGSSATASDVWSAANGYANAANNGNLISQTISAPGMAVSQYFLYDRFNRLSLAVEKPSNSSALVCPDAGSSWCQAYSYDNYGNRLIAQRSGLGTAGPTEPSGYDQTTNRITNWMYAGAGNITSNLVVDEDFAFGLVDVTDTPKYDLVSKVRATNIAALKSLRLLGSAPMLPSPPRRPRR